jgi:hypothetical protein
MNWHKNSKSRPFKIQSETMMRTKLHAIRKKKNKCLSLLKNVPSWLDYVNEFFYANVFYRCVFEELGRALSKLAKKLKIRHFVTTM